MAQPKILVVMHSAEGQTRRIAQVITDVLRESGDLVVETPVSSAPAPDDYDGVVAGDSIHMGKHSDELLRWLTDHRDGLTGKPTALFQVSLTSALHDEEHATVVHGYVEDLRTATGFDPDIVGEFAGRLSYTSYGWIKRRIIRGIAEKDGLSTDLSQDAEYTDWDAVARFGHDVHALVTGGQSSARTSPTGSPPPSNG